MQSQGTQTKKSYNATILMSGNSRAERVARKFGWPSWLDTAQGSVSWKVGTEKNGMRAFITVQDGQVIIKVEVIYRGTVATVLHGHFDGMHWVSAKVIGKDGDPLPESDLRRRFLNHIEHIGEPEVTWLDTYRDPLLSERDLAGAML